MLLVLVGCKHGGHTLSHVAPAASQVHVPISHQAWSTPLETPHAILESSHPPEIHHLTLASSHSDIWSSRPAWQGSPRLAPQNRPVGFQVFFDTEFSFGPPIPPPCSFFAVPYAQEMVPTLDADLSPVPAESFSPAQPSWDAPRGPDSLPHPT
jgi:hypothetical protein